MTEEQAVARNLNYSVGKQLFMGTFKPSITGERDGFVKVIADSNTGQLIGAHILAMEASEMIQGFVIARKAQLAVQEIAKIIPPNPTYYELVFDACKSVFGRTVRS